MQTVTITIGDQAENHRGMEMIGKMAKCGLTPEKLVEFQALFEKEGYLSEIVDLKEGLPKEMWKRTEDAYVLVVRGGVQALLGDKYTLDQMYDEQKGLAPDKKAYMYGRVVNKRARWNLCFADFSQEPDYEEGKGTVVDFKELPICSVARERLMELTGEQLVAEANYYYDIKKCGIGFHGDTERRIVIGMRLGASLPLHYRWYLRGECIGKPIKLLFNHGDLYFMSEKATGNDWKKPSKITLRHAAGSSSFLTVKK